MNRLHANSKTGRGRAAKAVIIGLGLVALVASTGCDYGLSSLLASTMGGYYGGDYGYGNYWPDYGLYDPTETIQGVVDYRQSVMDWSNNAWDEYIRQ